MNAEDDWTPPATPAPRSVLQRLLRPAPRLGEWLDSETAGAIVDRLELNERQIAHVDSVARRGSTSTDVRRKCQAILSMLRTQRRDLLACLERAVGRSGASHAAQPDDEGGRPGQR